MARKKIVETSEEQILEEAVVEEPATEEPEETVEDVIDVDIDAKDHIAKIQRYRIAKDNNRIIELDVGDGVGVVRRFNEAYKNIQEYAQQAENNEIKDSEDIDSTLEILDAQEEYIRGQINYIFGTDVCTPILQDVSVLTLRNGTYAFEYVITEVLKFYEAAITKEANAIKARVNKHTSKYW